MRNLVFAALFLAACQPKEATTTAETSTATAPSATASAAPAKVASLEADIEMMTADDCTLVHAFPYVTALSGEGATGLAAVQRTISEIYFGRRVAEADVRKQLQKMCDGEGMDMPPLAETKILHNGNGLLSIERQLLADMDPMMRHLIDLATGKELDMEAVLDKAAAEAHVFENANEARLVRAALPEDKITVRLMGVWIQKGQLAIEFGLEATPDKDGVCDMDTCYGVMLLPMSEAKPILKSGTAVYAMAN